MFNTLSEFYTSDIWSRFRRQIIFDRGLVCEHCGEPILKAYDAICHHKTPLTLNNVNDYEISLNESNISLVHHQCHNEIHARFGTYTRHVYLVYGAPGSGKSSFVSETAGVNDLVVDMDAIFQAISINNKYIKPNTLSSVAFRVRDTLLDVIKTRSGKWTNAFIVGGYPRVSERERLCQMYGAEEVFIECDRETCVARTIERPGWSDHIENWFSEFTESA